METSQSPKKKGCPSPRSRKSIAHAPSLVVNNEKENVTVDLAMASTSLAYGNITTKKSRSKSIGPGGLDALKEDPGNRRQSVATPFVKSILKPTAPISPLRKKSPVTKSRQLSPKKSTPDKVKSNSTDDVTVKTASESSAGSIYSHNPLERSSESIASQSGVDSPSRYRTRIAVRSEEEQQVAAKEREQQELLAHREARRKSLANRRVSFAPEATLHTWDVVELPEDSTVSSGSTNLTRRASALSAIPASPFPLPSPMHNSDALEPPSTPPAQSEEIQVAASPSDQRDLHQKKHRRSSVIPPVYLNNPNEFSSSPSSRASANDDEDEAHALLANEEENDGSGSDENDIIEGDSTMTGFDTGDSTTQSHGNSSTGSSIRLEEALRQAAKQAGTQGIEYDENGDISMELADDEITSAFQPWMKEGNATPQVWGASLSLQEENLNPFSPAFGASATEASLADQAGKTMDFTKAVGTILTDISQVQVSHNDHLQFAGTSVSRKSNGERRRSAGNNSVSGDETMDLTIAVGTIYQNQPAHSIPQPANGADSDDDDEDELTMEFTSAIGGLLDQPSIAQDPAAPSFDKPASNANLLEAEIFGYGGLSAITEHTEPSEDQTIEMDVTTAVGAILSQQLFSNKIPESNSSVETQIKLDHPITSPFRDNQLSNSRLSTHLAVITSETGSPGLTASERRINAKKTPPSRQSATPRSPSRQSSPTRKVTASSKQYAPTLASPATPSKTPPSGKVIRKTASPKKLFQPEARQKSPAFQNIHAAQLFTKDARSGEATPSIILKPRLRRASGMGVDKPGLGSPSVTTLLDRRRSIGEDAKPFTLPKEVSKSVLFEDLQIMKDDLKRKSTEEEYSLIGGGDFEKTCNDQHFGDEKDLTTNLKEVIESLTPRKKRLNGRKSLHVGAAKGLLGKRPVELDEDDEDESTSKRLKGREESPVKKVRLPAPPTKTQTTGRMTRSARRSLEEVTGNANLSTPTQLGKTTGSRSRKDQESVGHAEHLSRVDKVGQIVQEKAMRQVQEIVSSKDAVDRVHLQDFLNMTSIRFMELTTTKRRLTVAPNYSSDNMNNQLSGREDNAVSDGRSSELEQCVVAGACTIPMLELYQHSCRELKKYIAEGRSIVREIEADTYEENPPLFREYISASPESKSIMDNQFKNVKTHARLLSKAMWYEWRMKLLDSLKEGLVKVANEMHGDDNLLSQQHNKLESILPNLIVQHDKLEAENRTLQARADELTCDDQEELRDARSELVQIDKEIEAERILVDELQDEYRRMEERIEHAGDHRQRCLEQIEEAERVRLESRGWCPAEIATLQARVRALQKTHHWSIASASGTSLTMTYKRTLQLYFSPESFMRNKAVTMSKTSAEESPISLTYIGDAREYKPQPLSTEKRFFLQIMRAHLQCLPQGATKLKDLLQFVSCNWETACLIEEESRILGISHITDATILLDEVMAIKAVVLLRPLKTKVHVAFEVRVQSDEKAVELDVSVRPTATVFYGEEFKEKKMAEFLEQKINTRDQTGFGVGIWARAVLELQQRLAARERK